MNSLATYRSLLFDEKSCISDVQAAYIKSMDSRSTVGINRAAIWPPIPVLWLVLWPCRRVRNIFLPKKEQNYNENFGITTPNRNVSYCRSGLR
jgi:hypothetical protein